VQLYDGDQAEQRIRVHRTAAALPLSGALSALLEAAEPYGRPTVP
jgi:hypothetical protein